MTHQIGERAYHSFYQLCAGASSDLRSKLSLGHPEEFHYCAQGEAVSASAASLLAKRSHRGPEGRLPVRDACM